VLPVIAPESLSQVLQDLEVFYVDYINNACAKAYSPRSIRYVTKGLIVTTLLIDRSWTFWGCIDNNFLLLASNPNILARWKSVGVTGAGQGAVASDGDRR
jgi:hypothetical protein